MTRGFGGKWKLFFLELEHSYGLNADRAEHIWLVHYLFVPAINEDAQEWLATWNSHRLHVRGESPESPSERFLFGMVRHGARGIFDGQVPTNELPNYGVDWDVLADPELMRHHYQHNPDAPMDPSTAPSATAYRPERLSQIVCEPPNCPLTSQQLSTLHDHLLHAHHSRQVDLRSRDMLVRRQLWSVALAFCGPLFR